MDPEAVLIEQVEAPHFTLPHLEALHIQSIALSLQCSVTWQPMKTS